MSFKTIKVKDVQEEIGLLIRSFRKKEQISQQELADNLNLSRLTIHKLECGKNFTIDTLLKVLQHFDALEALNILVLEKRKEIEQTKSLY